MIGLPGWKERVSGLAFAEDHGASVKEGGAGHTAPKQGLHSHLSEKHQHHIGQRSQTYDLHGSSEKISEGVHSCAWGLFAPDFLVGFNQDSDMLPTELLNLLTDHEQGDLAGSGESAGDVR